jgi:hypothetical protein
MSYKGSVLCFDSISDMKGIDSIILPVVLHGCEGWSLTRVGKKLMLRILENNVVNLTGENKCVLNAY